MPDIDLTTGIDAGPIATGMASIRNMVAQTGSQIASLLAGPALFAGLSAATKSVVEYGARIFDLGQRFKTGTTELQQFGNAAERHGASLDNLALGFNRLDVALDKARKGDIEMQHALEGLNITNWRDKSLTLAQAMLEIGSSSMGAADMVKVLGKNGTELRDTLTALATGADRLAEAMDPKTIQALKNADTEMKKFGETSRVTTGNVLGFIDVLFAKPAAAADTTSRAFTALGDAIDHVFRGDFTGAIGILEKTGNEFDQENRKASQLRQTVEALATALHLVSSAPKIPPNVPTKESVQPTLITGDMTELTDRLEISKKEQQNRLAALGDEQRLTDLTAQRSKLQAEFEVAQRGGTSTTERQLDLENQIADLDGKIIPLEKQVADAKEKAAEADAKALEDAQDALATAKEGAAEQALIVSGHQEAADILKIEFDYEQKIKDAIDAANEAWSEGNQILAETNTELANTLEQEKQIALTQAQVNAANAAGKAAGIPGSAGVSAQGQILPGHLFPAGQAAGIQILGYDPNVIRATDPITGKFDPALYAKLSNEALIKDLQFALSGSQVGPPTDIGFVERAQLQAKGLLISSNEAERERLAELALLSQFQTTTWAAGAPAMIGTDQGTSVQIAQLSQQIQIMQQQLATQQQMLAMLTPQPG